MIGQAENFSFHGFLCKFKILKQELFQDHTSGWIGKLSQDVGYNFPND